MSNVECALDILVSKFLTSRVFNLYNLEKKKFLVAEEPGIIKWENLVFMPKSA